MSTGMPQNDCCSRVTRIDPKGCSQSTLASSNRIGLDQLCPACLGEWERLTDTADGADLLRSALWVGMEETAMPQGRQAIAREEAQTEVPHAA